MADPCQIRRAREHDLTAATAIEHAVFADPWSLASFRAVLDDPASLFFVAEVGAELAGYLVAQGVSPEADLQNVAVAPAHRRRGIARALVLRALEELGNWAISRAFLEVRESNLPARALYRSLGFEEIGRRPGYYRRPREDALVLVRGIATSGVSLVDKRT